MPLSPYVPLIEVTRGPIVESVHNGTIAICDPTGRLVASAGDADAVVFLRSSSKPYQVLPLVEMGGMEQFHLNDQELAVMCASHNGTDEHVRVVQGIQEKIGVTEEDLLCGVHSPSDVPTAERMIKQNEINTPLRHNCSGKHTGMLAQAILQGFDKQDYINPAHPVQRQILRAFSEMCGVPEDEIILGTDGCSAPVFAIPMRAAAFAFARLADPSSLPEPRRGALQRIFRAMTQYPEMVAGRGSFDTDLMIAGKGRILAKRGAEGYQALSLLPASDSKENTALGIAIKISDGDLTQRARPTASVEVLRQLDALNKEQLNRLGAYVPRPLYNWRHLAVGEIRPAFELEFH